MSGDHGTARPMRLLVEHRTKHHATGSGHAGGNDHLRADAVIDGSGAGIPYRVAKTVSRASRSQEYGTLGVLREVEALRAGRRSVRTRESREVSIHFLFGEHDANHLPRITHRLGWHTSAWFHVPADRLAFLLDHRPSLKRIDRAWAVAESQLPVLEATFGRDRVSVARLGVDTDAFSPPHEDCTRERSVLFVGSHLRDFAQLKRVFAKLAQQHPTVARRAIVPAHTAKHVEGLDAEVSVAVSDAELLAAYRAAGVVFLPFRSATANLSVLESLACGCAIVATEVEGVSEYTDDAVELVPPGDDAAAVNAILRVLDDAELAVSKRRAARVQALTLSWAEVTKSFRWPDEPLLPPSSLRRVSSA